MNPTLIGILLSIGTIISFVPAFLILLIWSIPVCIAQIWRRGEKRISKIFRLWSKITVGLLGISILSLSISLIWLTLRIFSSTFGAIGKLLGIALSVVGLAAKMVFWALSFFSSSFFANVAAWSIVLWFVIWATDSWEYTYLALKTVENLSWDRHGPEIFVASFAIFGVLVIEFARRKCKAICDEIDEWHESNGCYRN